MKYYVSIRNFKRGNMTIHNSSKCPVVTKTNGVIEITSSDLIGKTYRRCSYCFG